MTSLHQTIEQVLGTSIVSQQTLGVGFGLTGLHIELADGREAAVKAGSTAHMGAGDAQLELEGYMLVELRQKTNLPVPEVYYYDDELLVMEWKHGGGGLGKSAQIHAAELLAESHSIPFSTFGFERDTVIGPLFQPNPEENKWVSFFTDHRIMHMTDKAVEEKRLSDRDRDRLAKLCEKFPDLLPEPAHPALLHGDLWTGNVISNGSKITGMIDPAIYCGHPEIELAFTTMFGTFGTPFFDAYEALIPLEPGFHKTRKDIYNLYSTLVHIRLFGSGYLPGLHAVLERHDL